MTSKSKLWSFIFILISGAIILFPLVTHALIFQYGKPITIDHTKVPATLTNFPVLVSFANDNDLRDHVTSPNGYDIVFTDSIGNQLDHELESWDSGAGTLGKSTGVRPQHSTRVGDSEGWECRGH